MFFFNSEADSTDPNHIVYHYHPLLRVKDTELGKWIDQTKTGRIRYNYADVKIEAPDRLTYTLSSGDLFGTWHQNDTIVPTGIYEPAPAQSQENLAIYPNPATHEATIKLSQASAQDRMFYVFDAMGRMVSEFGINAGEEQHRLNLEAFPTGIYFITGKRNGEKTATLVVE